MSSVAQIFSFSSIKYLEIPQLSDFNKIKFALRKFGVRRVAVWDEKRYC